MTAREQDEQAIRELCKAEGFDGLAIVCIEGGVNVETTRRLARYVALLVDETARRAAQAAAAVLMAERMAPGVVTNPKKES